MIDDVMQALRLIAMGHAYEVTMFPDEEVVFSVKKNDDEVFIVRVEETFKIINTEENKSEE